jgi:alpha-1,3-rhamnosyl/mannosyltransferase
VTRHFQQRIFTNGVAARRPDIYHEPNFLPYRFRGPTVITVHDLSWIRYPETHPRERVKIMDKLLPPAVQNAAHICVDSEFVRGEVIDYFRIAPDKVTTTLLAPRDVFKPRSPEERLATLTKHGLADQQYFLCVGTLEPRKNVVAALRAHGHLPQELRRRFPLVLVGMRGWLEGELLSGIQRGEIVPLGFVSDEELADIYSGATAVVYPSIYEGFGLPPLEAMACGTPAIMSNVSSLPEVAGDAAVLHDPHDIDALSEAMRRFAEDSAFRSDRSVASLRQAARFSWDRCARETVEVYRRVLRRT